MKRLLCLACLVPLLIVGCALTDYGIITDNNQISGKRAGLPNPVIDTKGKAYWRCSSQVATIWPDGTDDLFSFIDQRADGTAKLTTYNNHSTGSEPTFRDDLYCNLAHDSCSIFTAPDNNDANLFDGVFNENCSGARSLSVMLSTGRYYGECGRIRGQGSKLSLAQKGALFNSAIFETRMGREGLLYRLNPDNMTVHLTTDDGERFLVPLRGSVEFWGSAQDSIGLLDMRNSLVASTMSWYAGFLDNHATYKTTATVSYNGISASFDIAGAHPGINAKTVLSLRNRAF